MNDPSPSPAMPTQTRSAIEAPDIDIVIEPYDGWWSKFRWKVFVTTTENRLLTYTTTRTTVARGFARTRDKGLTRAQAVAARWDHKIRNTERIEYGDPS